VSPAQPRRRRLWRGFTLLELMVALVVVAILTAVALPSYRQHVQKSRRADATTTLLTLAQAMERWYSERGTYAGATVGSSGLMPSTSPQGYYTLSITSQDANGFRITAAPAGAQAGDACGSYTLDQAGAREVSGGSLTAAQCW
jgi:type IV pilus assembly protein PilE